jgi:hypothetical protein
MSITAIASPGSRMSRRDSQLRSGQRELRLRLNRRLGYLQVRRVHHRDCVDELAAAAIPASGWAGDCV